MVTAVPAWKVHGWGLLLVLLLGGCTNPPVEAPDGQAPLDTSDPSTDPPAPAPENPPPVEAPDATEAWPPWPSLQNATIRPGSQVIAADYGGGCTSNFLFRTPDNATLLLGIIAHCMEMYERGDEMIIRGGEHLGHLWYSSDWKHGDACKASVRPPQCASEFALVAINASDRHLVHPATWHIGGPTGVGALQDVSRGDELLLYMNSTTRLGISEASVMRGVVTKRNAEPPSVEYATVTVGGDSGSGVQHKDTGEAIGMVVMVSGWAYSLEDALKEAAKEGYKVELVTWGMLDRDYPLSQ